MKMKPLWQIRKRQSVHRTKRYVSSSWIVPLPMRTGSNPISDLRIASCYISIAAYRKANRSVHPIWMASENVNPISENLLRTRLLFVVSQVGDVRGGGGCSAAIPSISRTETPAICTSFCRIRKLNILDGFSCS